MTAIEKSSLTGLVKAWGESGAPLIRRRRGQIAGDAISGLAADEGDGSVRAIRRGLAVLRAINEQGAATVMEIARKTGIPYPTAGRIAQTLAGEGMVERDATSRRYRPTARVRTLASGFREDMALAEIARPQILALADRLIWPISLCARVGSRIMIQYSTHHRTTLTLSHYAAGYTMPITDCAAGRAYLSFCSDRERELVRLGLDASGEQVPLHSRPFLDDAALLASIRARGFSSHARNPHNADPGKISSLAAPIFDGVRLASILTLSFFASAMPMAQAEAEFGAVLVAAAGRIGAELSRLPD